MSRRRNEDWEFADVTGYTLVGRTEVIAQLVAFIGTPSSIYFQTTIPMMPLVSHFRWLTEDDE